MEPLCKHGGLVAGGRNQSAPMILDAIERPPRIQVENNGHQSSTSTSAASDGLDESEASSGGSTLAPVFTPTTPTTPTFMDEIDAEWIIPLRDIQVGEVIARRGDCTINRYYRQ